MMEKDCGEWLVVGRGKILLFVIDDNF
jgi:hypothetical protein